MGISEDRRELAARWHDFCDCDYFENCDTFAERMEAAGLIKLVSVTREALEDGFAEERGIYPGGMMWELTADGHRAMEKKHG